MLYLLDLFLFISNSLTNLGRLFVIPGLFYAKEAVPVRMMENPWDGHPNGSEDC